MKMSKKAIFNTIRVLTLTVFILASFIMLPGFEARTEGGENSEGTITVYSWDRLKREMQLNTVARDNNWHSVSYGIIPVYKTADSYYPYTFRSALDNAETVALGGDFAKVCYNSSDDAKNQLREPFCTLEKISSFTLQTTKTKNNWGGDGFYEYRLVNSEGNYVYSTDKADAANPPFYGSVTKTAANDVNMLVFGHTEYWYPQNIGGKVKMRPYEFCFCFKTKNTALAFGESGEGKKIFAPLSFYDMGKLADYALSSRIWYSREETWKTYGGAGERYTAKDGDVFIIPDGSVILEGTEFIIEPGAVVSVEGRLINNGTIYNYGTLLLQENASVISTEYKTSGSGSIYCRGCDSEYIKETRVSDGKGGTKVKKVTLKGEGCIVVKSGAKLALHDKNAVFKLEKGTTCYNEGYILIPGGLYMGSAVFDNHGTCILGYGELYDGNFTAQEIPWRAFASYGKLTASETDPYLAVVPNSVSDYSNTENYVKKGENWYDFTTVTNSSKTVFDN